MNDPTPLLDFFKRGEVASDVRLLAAQGALAPRAHEQLAILVLLTADSDPQIRQAANDTLDRIPLAALSAFLARSSVPVGLCEFFADRGIFPAETSPPVAPEEGDRPFVGAALDDTEQEVEGAPSLNAVQRVAAMGFTERLKAAMKGSREVRAILIRDTNKMIAAAVLSSPKLTEVEIEGFARMANVSEDVLRAIGGTRMWMKRYAVVLALAKNPKTPIAMSMNLLARLNDRDLSMLSVDRNVPDQLRIAARKKVVAAASRK